MQETTNILKENNISPSISRIKIYDYIKDNNHTTIDEIYNALVKDLPTLSKTTVYNVIKVFCEQKLIKSVLTGESITQYEIRYQPHSHFVCSVCGTIYDIPAQRLASVTLEDGFEIEEEEVIFRGVCPNCKQ